MATAATARPTGEELAARVKATAAALAATGAALAEARERLQQIRRDGGPLAQFEEPDAARAVAFAEAAEAKARAVYAAAREAQFLAQVEDHEREDARDVAELGAGLVKLAAVERRRLARVRQFEARTGRQYPHEAGPWPELADESGGDVSRLDRWLAWASQRRGLSR
jgi:hypothetical protein